MTSVLPEHAWAALGITKHTWVKVPAVSAQMSHCDLSAGWFRHTMPGSSAVSAGTQQQEGEKEENPRHRHLQQAGLQGIIELL